MDLVSVIIPVYNSQEYLKECLDSILNQTYKNIEIIIIDDGSTDNSLSICKEYSILNKNIKLLSKENRGVSHSRNVGIKMAKGKWIIFLDSDDLMESNSIMDAVSLANENNFDTVCWNYKKLINNELINCKDINEHIVNNKKDLNSILYSIIESSYYDVNYLGDYIRAPWAKLLNKKIIDDNNFCFDENLCIGEDAIFLLEYFKKAKNVKFINQYNNIYRIISTSAVRKYNDDLDRQITIQLEKINNLTKDIEINYEILKTVKVKFYLNSIYELMYNYNIKSNYKMNNFNLVEFVKCSCIELDNIKLSLLNKSQIIIYIFVKFKQIRLLQCIFRIKALLKNKINKNKLENRG